MCKECKVWITFVYKGDHRLLIWKTNMQHNHVSHKSLVVLIRSCIFPSGVQESVCCCFQALGQMLRSVATQKIVQSSVLTSRTKKGELCQYRMLLTDRLLEHIARWSWFIKSTSVTLFKISVWVLNKPKVRKEMVDMSVL